MNTCRKLVALLMTAIMLLGMLPVAQAQNISCSALGMSHSWGPLMGDSCYGGMRYCTVCGEGQQVSGSHNWYTRVNEQPTCTEDGWSEIICSVCDSEKGDPQRIPALGHNWGSWKEEVAAACKTGGRSVHYCTRCGATETQSTPPLGHDWTDWYEKVAPTCTEEGVTQMDCRRCGTYSSNNLPATGHTFGDWHVTRAPQLGIPGEEQRECTKCGLEEKRELPALEGELPTVTLKKTIENTPANGEFFVPGEQIEYGLTLGVYGPGKTVYSDDYVVDNPVIYDPLKGGDGIVLSVEYSRNMGHSFLYTVTAEDAQRGYVENTAYATWNYRETGESGYMESNTVVAPCGLSGLRVTKTVISTPSRPSGVYEPGDTISYLITVENISGEDLTDVVISDSLKGKTGNAVVASYPLMPAGEGVSNHFYYTATMEDATLGVEGVYNTATATGYKPDGTQITGVSNTVFTEVCHISEIGISKSVVNTPANGMFFVPGETIEFAIHLTNDSNYPFYVPIVTDPLCSDQYIYDAANDESYLSMVMEGVFYAGMSATVNASYVVTEADAAAGFVENVASVWYMTFNGVEFQRSASAIAPCGPADLAPVSLVKGILNTPANGMYFVPGEAIEFTISAVNNAPVDIAGVRFTDPLFPGSVFECANLPVGATESFSFSYIVTEMDAAAGLVKNYASGVAHAPGGDIPMASNTVTAPCGFAGPDPFGMLNSLQISKSVESLPANGSYYTQGETVAYRIAYTNTGEITLTNVTIHDALSGLGEIASAEKLEPGETRTCHFSHTVTETDVLWGYISNTAVGMYSVNDFAGSATSNTVQVDTNGKEDIWYVFHPIDGEDSTPYDPGLGWLHFYVTEDGGAPFGSINSAALRGGKSYCEHIITSRDNASASYETNFCSAHASTQGAALTMLQAAPTPEVQVQAADYAVALWRSEAEAIYQSLFDAADSTAKATLMTEYARFLTDVVNRETMLKVLYPDQPALVAQKIAAMWEDKCVNLCYETYADAAQRKDSLLSVTPSAGAVADSCGCDVTAEENGKKAYTHSYCPVHAFPFSMTDALLKDTDTVESWTTVRQIWSVELSKAYNDLYVKLGENSALAMAEYHSLTQWMMAREGSLIALYPDHPEVAAQLMVKLIMEHVNDLCQMTK